MSGPIIPISNIVIAAVTATILVAAAVTAILILRKHAVNWGNGMIYGLLIGIAFLALVPMLLSVVVSMIPDATDYLTEHEVLNQVISVSLQLLMTILTFTAGMALLKRSCERMHQSFNLGNAILFGYAVFLVELFVGQQLSICVQYFPAAIQINQMGYDNAIASVQQAGLSAEEAAQYIKGLQEIDAAEFLYAGLSLIVKGFFEMAMGALSYGIFSGKLEKKFTGLLIGAIVLLFALDFAGYILSLSSIIYIIVVALYAAAMVYLVLRLLKKYLPEEWEEFKKVKKNGSNSGGFFGRRQTEPPKMPKIQMPKE